MLHTGEIHLRAIYSHSHRSRLRHRSEAANIIWSNINSPIQKCHRSRKSVVFPLTAILESLAADYSATFINNVVLIVEFGDGSATHTLNTILIGTCEKK